MQETAEETLKREMREEMQTDITVQRLLWVVENFFQHGGKAFHELGKFQALKGDKTWNCPAMVGKRVFVRNHEEMACYELE